VLLVRCARVPVIAGKLPRLKQSAACELSSLAFKIQPSHTTRQLLMQEMVPRCIQTSPPAVCAGPKGSVQQGPVAAGPAGSDSTLSLVQADMPASNSCSSSTCLRPPVGAAATTMLLPAMLTRRAGPALKHMIMGCLPPPTASDFAFECCRDLLLQRQEGDTALRCNGGGGVHGHPWSRRVHQACSASDSKAARVQQVESKGFMLQVEQQLPGSIDPDFTECCGMLAAMGALLE